MDKKQQIEEIARTICKTCKERFEISKKCKNVIEPCLAAYAHAERLCNAGYRKIDESCAVITKIELKEYKRQAVKEFAEKLQKELPCRDYTYNGNTYSMILTSSMKYVIDKLLKEYEE